MLLFITGSRSIRVTILLFLKELWFLGPAPSTSNHPGCPTKLICQQVPLDLLSGVFTTSVNYYISPATFFHELPVSLSPVLTKIPRFQTLDFQRIVLFRSSTNLQDNPRLNATDHNVSFIAKTSWETIAYWYWRPFHLVLLRVVRRLQASKRFNCEDRTTIRSALFPISRLEN